MLYIYCTFFARFFEHAMTALINTYSNTEFRVNLQDLHFSTRLNADLSLNHRYFQKYYTMVAKKWKLLILEKKIANEFLEYQKLRKKLYEFSILENNVLLLEIHALILKIQFLKIMYNITTYILKIRKYCFYSIKNSFSNIRNPILYLKFIFEY